MLLSALCASAMADDLLFSRFRILNDAARKVDAIPMTTRVRVMAMQSSNSEKPDWENELVVDFFIERGTRCV